MRSSHVWIGHSRERYVYRVYDWPGMNEWPVWQTARPANFIFCCEIDENFWWPLLIGECADLGACTSSPSRYRDIGGVHTTHLHIRYTQKPAATRRRELADLVLKWRPPGNLTP